MTPASFKYLSGYSTSVLARVQGLIEARQLGASVAARHPEQHTVRSDRALYDYAQAMKSQYLRSAEPLAKVAFDPRLQIVQQALGTHTMVSRVQGGRLKAKRELRVASVFKEAPAALLRTIVVHELAHLREREHDKAFYALCLHMEPDYHRLEFDLRLWLTARELEAGADEPPG